MAEGSRQISFERMVAELQRLIDEEEQALYSAKVLAEARNPKNLGRMEKPDGHAIIKGWCGDTMEVYLRLNGTRIETATFMTDGCGPSVACGSMLTKMLQGMTLDEASKVKAEDLISALDGLPEESAHCAELAVDTLQEAMSGHQREGKIGL